MGAPCAGLGTPCRRWTLADAIGAHACLCVQRARLLMSLHNLAQPVDEADTPHTASSKSLAQSLTEVPAPAQAVQV